MPVPDLGAFQKKAPTTEQMLMQALPALVNGLNAGFVHVANVIAELANAMGPNAGHMPCIAPLANPEDAWGVFCLECSKASEGHGYVFPCLINPDGWPEGNVLLLANSDAQLATERRNQEALLLVRRELLDRPKGSPEYDLATVLLRVLSPSSE